MATRLPTTVRNARADAITARIDAGAGAGLVKVYTGAQPASADDAPTGTLLVTITLPDPSFSAAVGGVATGNNPAAVGATAAGTAGWFRTTDSAGTTVHDGSVSATGGTGQLQLSAVDLVVGQQVDVTSYTWTEPA